MFKFLKALFQKKDFDGLEQVLYEADLGPLAQELIQIARKFDEPIPEIKKHILSLFKMPTIPQGSPHVILLVGVNGSGKTTTIAKLSQRYRGKKVLIAACDTFRAAAVEQLEKWADKTGAELIKAQPKSDPSAVAFDALQAAIARKADVLLIDTAGRLQNKTELMDELAKLRRTLQKLLPQAPHETLLTLDATLGQNAIDQAKTFHQFTPLTGIVLTKLDGSAKGGIAAAIQKQIGIPILYIGTGETPSDFTPFNPQEYVDALFS